MTAVADTIWKQQNGNAEFSATTANYIVDTAGDYVVDTNTDNLVDTAIVNTQVSNTVWTESPAT